MEWISIPVGDYMLSFNGETYFISHKSGEGMEISVEKLEKWIEELFAKEF